MTGTLNRTTQWSFQTIGPTSVPLAILLAKCASSGVNSWNYHYDIGDPIEEASGFGVPYISELSAI
ncbi:hypothetical protein N7476_006786 [Penicillium atrosanguineum]|uniref:Uncharacterized protein n=1 Tax=Penicillium atrosanguineum TaxID=1132637 RepID=A0A9W9PZX6_9EURO|nr:hypothetical protein N7476_006786 [Penicillium atrosanguineum]